MKAMENILGLFDDAKYVKYYFCENLHNLLTVRQGGGILFTGNVLYIEQI